MLSTLVFTSLVLAPVLRVAAFAVSNPEGAVCQKAKVTWEATAGPYSVWLVNPSNPCDEPYLDLGETDKTFFEWDVTVPAGLDVQYAIQDVNGNEAFSEVRKFGAGDAACVPAELAALAPAPAPSASSSSVASSAATPTTLVVTPTSTARAAVTSAAGPSAPVVAVGGAVNGLDLPGNSAAVNRVSSPVVLLGALAGAAFLAL